MELGTSSTVGLCGVWGVSVVVFFQEGTARVVLQLHSYLDDHKVHSEGTIEQLEPSVFKINHHNHETKCKTLIRQINYMVVPC